MAKGMLRHVRRAVADQLSLLAMIWRRPDLFIVMLAVWVASFGGGEHASVTTYYLLAVGASTEQLGNFGVIRTICVLLVSPLYGWLLDRRTAYLPVVMTSFCCTFGCFLRGLAPVGDAASLYVSYTVMGLGAIHFFRVVGAYVALTTPRDMRALAVAGFSVQVSALNLMGTAVYPAFDWALQAGGMEDQLLRYRFHMSICSAFCIFGFIYMAMRFRPAVFVDKVPQPHEEEKLDAPVNKLQLSVLLASLVVQSFGETVVSVLWPLHIRKLGWGSHEYAYLDITSKLFTIGGTMAYPALARFLGYRLVATGLPAVACMTSAAAFLQPDASLYGQTHHVINALAFLSACGVMKVCFQHLTTLAVPAPIQGRVFALLQVLESVGGIAGNLFGTRLVDHETSFSGPGATPFLISSALFMVAGCTVAGLLVAPQTCLDPVVAATRGQGAKLGRGEEDGDEDEDKTEVGVK